MKGLAAIAAAVVALVLALPAAAATQKCNGSASLCNRTFDDVVLPATHNSMSAASLGWSIPNQPDDVAGQLKAGIRGLLLDTHYGHDDGTGKIITDKTKTSKSKAYLCHEACEIGATPLIDVLRDIRDFLKKNPSNVLLIDQEDYITPKDFAAEVKKAGLLKYVYTGKTGKKWPTLRTMIAGRSQVVMLAEHVVKGGPSWYHLDYTGIVQETNYNWATPDLITEPAQWKSSCAPNRGGSKGALFLLNHWSPPVAPKPAESAVVNATDTIVGRALECRKVRGRMPTIVAVDMYRSGGLFPAVKKLNAMLK
jgi:hypothetical protein